MQNDDNDEEIMIMGSRKIWTVVVMLFGPYTAYAPKSEAQWGGFSFNPSSIDVSPPKIGGELGKIGAEREQRREADRGFCQQQRQARRRSRQ